MVYTELNNLLFINTVDVYATYSVFLAEDKPGDHSNMDALLKPSAMKTNVAVDIREVAGESYSADLKPKNQARDITLSFICHGDGKTGFLTNYKNFISFIKAGLTGKGWLAITLPEIANTTFNVFVLDCSEYSNLTYMADGMVAARFKIRFREPNPAI